MPKRGSRGDKFKPNPIIDVNKQTTLFNQQIENLYRQIEQRVRETQNRLSTPNVSIPEQLGRQFEQQRLILPDLNQQTFRIPLIYAPTGEPFNVPTSPRFPVLYSPQGGNLLRDIYPELTQFIYDPTITNVAGITGTTSLGNILGRQPPVISIPERIWRQYPQQLREIIETKYPNVNIQPLSEEEQEEERRNWLRRYQAREYSPRARDIYIMRRFMNEVLENRPELLSNPEIARILSRGFAPYQTLQQLQQRLGRAIANRDTDEIRNVLEQLRRFRDNLRTINNVAGNTTQRLRDFSQNLEHSARTLEREGRRAIWRERLSNFGRFMAGAGRIASAIGGGLVTLASYTPYWGITTPIIGGLTTPIQSLLTPMWGEITGGIGLIPHRVIGTGIAQSLWGQPTAGLGVAGSVLQMRVQRATTFGSIIGGTLGAIAGGTVGFFMGNPVIGAGVGTGIGATAGRFATGLFTAGERARGQYLEILQQVMSPVTGMLGQMTPYLSRWANLGLYRGLQYGNVQGLAFGLANIGIAPEMAFQYANILAESPMIFGIRGTREFRAMAGLITAQRLLPQEFGQVAQLGRFVERQDVLNLIEALRGNTRILNQLRPYLGEIRQSLLRFGSVAEITGIKPMAETFAEYERRLAEATARTQLAPQTIQAMTQQAGGILSNITALLFPQITQFANNPLQATAILRTIQAQVRGGNLAMRVGDILREYNITAPPEIANMTLAEFLNNRVQGAFAPLNQMIFGEQAQGLPAWSWLVANVLGMTPRGLRAIGIATGGVQPEGRRPLIEGLPTTGATSYYDIIKPRQEQYRMRASLSMNYGRLKEISEFSSKIYGMLEEVISNGMLKVDIKSNEFLRPVQKELERIIRRLER